MATGDEPLPLHSLRHMPQRWRAEHESPPFPLRPPPPRRNLHLPDPRSPTTHVAATVPESLAEMAPKEVADHIRCAGRWFKKASGRQRGKPNPLCELHSPECPPPPTKPGPLEGEATCRERHLAAPSKAATTQLDATDQHAYTRELRTWFGG